MKFYLPEYSRKQIITAYIRALILTTPGSKYPIKTAYIKRV
jgi:hypothetical protein